MLNMNPESKTNAFKKNLALVFDDDLRTRPLRWNNYVDIVIITMIVLSTVSVFLTTFTLSPAWQRALKVFDWIVQIFFTIEVSLRIWAADEIDPKYRGFWGRVRYCFSFYGLVDFLATYPVLLGMACPTLMLSTKLFQVFRVLRVARLLRVFRYMPAFRFLGEAVSSKKKEILVSFQFLTVVTIILSFILFLVERDANPEMLGDGWRSIVWSFAKYLGDPGKIVDEPLVTTGGKIISFLVGILGIAIFAVPIGLLSSGFSEAIEKDKRTNELNDFRQSITKAFRRTGNKSLREHLDQKHDGGGVSFKTLNFVPQRVLVSQLQVREGLKFDDIIDTCNEFDDFRLKNLAVALSDEEIADDRFIVEHFPLTNKYGCYRPRQSKVTIVCPTSTSEVGIGWFTYYLALMGGFNYISKEIEADGSDTDSYFNYSPEPLCNGQPRSAYGKNDKEALAMLTKKQELRTEFENNLKEAAQADWVIVVVEQLKTSNNQVDFHFNDCRKDGSDPTVAAQETYQRFRDSFASLMNDEFGLSTMNRSPRYPLMKKNIGYTIRKDNPNANVFVLRPSSELMNFNANKLAIAYEMAQLISEHFDNGRGPRPDDVEELKWGGFGFPNEDSSK